MFKKIQFLKVAVKFFLLLVAFPYMAVGVLITMMDMGF